MNSELMVSLRLDRRNWTRQQLEAFQLQRLNQLLADIMPENRFYQEKFKSRSFHLSSLQELSDLPLTTKGELIDSSNTMGLARHHTWSTDRYQRFHRTSGTTGRPLVVLDTAEDWLDWIETWQYVLDAAQVSSTDRVFMAFSFGPFVGFWSAHDACLARGAMVIPGGGLSTLARLDLIASTAATVVCCTPSYALHMAETAASQQLDLRQFSVRQIIVAGEPGGSIPEIRNRIESAWGATVTDHSGATEIGPWGFGSSDGRSLHVIEPSFIAEFLPLSLSSTASKENLFELVLTNLFRRGAPVLRYRTGDLVEPQWSETSDCRFVRLIGGVRGRADDMLIIRGVNLFPSSIEALLRSFPEVTEYRLIATRTGQLDQIHIEVEDRLHQPARIADRLQIQLGLRVSVDEVPANSLPRFEGKAKRFIDRRVTKET